MSRHYRPVAVGTPFRLRAGWLTLVLTLGCAMRPQAGPVTLGGTPAERDALVGRWEGTYRVPGQARRGVVRFELTPESDTARGEVEITFARGLRLYGDPPESELHRHTSTVIAIDVVLVQARAVRGTLAPYWDPDCDCRAIAVFDGELDGDRIHGTFSTHREGTDSVLLRGKWSARRG